MTIDEFEYWDGKAHDARLRSPADGVCPGPRAAPSSIFGPDAPARQIPVRYDLFNSAEFAETKSRVGASMSQFWRRGSGIDTMVQEYYAKVLVGELDVDASWDDWVKRWSEAGGAELIEGYELLPLLEPALRGEIVY